MLEQDLVYAKLQPTYGKFIFHGVFKRHKLYGSRVSSCFCVNQCFQEGAFSIGRVSKTKTNKQKVIVSRCKRMTEGQFKFDKEMFWKVSTQSHFRIVFHNSSSLKLE